MIENDSRIGLSARVKIRGVLSSLIFSIPLSYLFYFILSNASQTYNTNIPLFISAVVVFLISAHAYLYPTTYIKIIKSLGLVWSILAFVGSIISSIGAFLGD